MTKVVYLIVLSSLFFQLPVRASIEDNVKCLREFYSQMEDPLQSLGTWNFNKEGDERHGYICYFSGISCWHANDGNVWGLQVREMGLQGEVPSGLRYCRRMTTLDLSNNLISGKIPKDLCKWLPYVVFLDLSHNQLTGPIPAELSFCTYLNLLRLDGNQLTGNIPWELTRLDRLNVFNFSDNKLSGQIPSPWAHTEFESFESNDGLCGAPLQKSCNTSDRGLGPSLLATFAVLYGLALIIWVTIACRWWNSREKDNFRPRPPSLDANNGPKSTKVCLFEKPIKKMRLASLVAATGDFSDGNVIWRGRTGVLYKAELPDGSLLAVKRLRACPKPTKEFKSEMKILGNMRHPNVMPLLGYCIAGDEERLLLYKYMAGGTLSHRLHCSRQEKALELPTRLAICIGIARGLQWLHSSCIPHVLHHNLTSELIFLDEECQPRISGVTYDALCEEEYTSFTTESPYDAPERWRRRTSRPTAKGDVYSFGVVVLEMITCMKPGDRMTHAESLTGGTLMMWMRRSLGHVDKAIQMYVEKSPLDEQHKSMIAELMAVAFRCVCYDPDERPPMDQVYVSLKNIGDKYNVNLDTD